VVIQKVSQLKELTEKKARIMQDTLKTSIVGLGGSCIGFMDWFPEVVSVCVGVITLVYMCIKVYKELK
jgi:hypothetical protein